MTWLTALQDWLLANAGAWWSYLVTGLLCFVDGFFPPLPSESIVIGMATLGFHGERGVNLWLLLAVAGTGAFLGDNVAYLIGRWAPLQKLFRGERGQRILDRADDLLGRKGAEVLLTARFIPLYRVAVNMMAGNLRYPWRRFLVVDLASVSLWGAFSLGIGSVAGALFHKFPLLGVVAGVALGLVVGWIIDRIGAWREKRRLARIAERAVDGIDDIDEQPGASVRRR